MKVPKIMVAIALSSFAGHNAWALAASPAYTVGERYELTRSYKTSEQSSDGASGSSSGHDTIIEKVIALRDGGVELEYGPAESATPEDRVREWKFPARVFKPANGPMQLLNTGELEKRLGDWLKAAGWDRSMCGRWIFTWNAFRIDCDPQSAVEAIEMFDLAPPDFREGASFQDADATAPGTIVRQTTTPNGDTFAVMLTVNPAAVQRARAETDVATGEILRKPVAFEAVLDRHSKEQVSGTISITFKTDANGVVRKRTKVTKLEITLPDGTSESRTATETVERRPASAIVSH